jgi:hypothetical protein
VIRGHGIDPMVLIIIGSITVAVLLIAWIVWSV